MVIGLIVVYRTEGKGWVDLKEATCNSYNRLELRISGQHP